MQRIYSPSQFQIVRESEVKFLASLLVGQSSTIGRSSVFVIFHLFSFLRPIDSANNKASLRSLLISILRFSTRSRLHKGTVFAICFTTAVSVFSRMEAKYFIGIFPL